MPTILHIGSDKTGTTAIQHALATHRTLLDDAGFIYPDLDGRPDHRVLLDDPTRLNVDGTGTVLLSFEGFWPAGPERLDALLRRLPAPVSVLAWTRSPQNYVDAAFRQQCRKAHSTLHLHALMNVVRTPPAVNPVARRGVKRFEQIRPWKERFGDALTVRDYEPDADDMVSAFARAAGLPSLESGLQRRNISPSIDALYALAVHRQSVSHEVDANRFLQLASDLGESADGFLTPESVRRRCWQRSLPACEQMGLHYDWTPDSEPTEALNSERAQQVLQDVLGRY